MLDIIATLFPIFALIVLGFFLDKAPFITKSLASGLNQFVYWVGFPALLFGQMAEIRAGQISFHMLAGLILSVIISWVGTMALTTGGFKTKKPEHTMFALLATFPNFAYMGLSVIALIRPDNKEAFSVAMLAAFPYIGLLLFADAKLEFSRHRGENTGQAVVSLFLSMLKNPMLMGTLLGMLIGLSGLTLPKPVGIFFSMLGNTAAPCALITMGMFLGTQLHVLKKITPAWLRKQALLHGIKLLAVPLLAFLCLRLCGTDGIALGTGTIIAATPIGAAAYVISEKYGLLPEESSLGIVINTVLSVITLPLTILLMENMGYF